MTAAAVLRTIGLCKSFGGNRVVDGVDMVVAQGERIALVGPNGAGKTSLLNLLSGQLRPTAGRIDFAGADVTRTKPSAPARRALFRSFQDGGTFARMTAQENVAVAGLVRGMSRAEADDAAEAALGRVGLAPVVGWTADRLSGGQRKLIDFARLLVARPRLALLDEPTAGVNPAVMTVMAETIDALGRDGTSFVVISHDLPWVFEFCPKVIVLATGRILASGTPETILADENVRKAYIA